MSQASKARERDAGRLIAMAADCLTMAGACDVLPAVQRDRLRTMAGRVGSELELLRGEVASRFGSHDAVCDGEDAI